MAILKTFTDSISTFEAGIDSGINPLLLKKNQAAFALNASVRDGFFKTRPPIQKKNLIFHDVLLAHLVETGLFQGGGYYRPDYGTESLLAQIAGYLIKFTEVGNSWMVTDVSVPSDFNDPTTSQVWMWQSEKWMIIQDGSGKLPIFFDGTTSRRSFGESITLGSVTAVSTTTPAIGEVFTATLDAPYTGVFNIPVIFNKEFYQPIAQPNPVPTYHATLKNISDTAGNTISSGSQIIVRPNFVGTQGVSGYYVGTTRAGYIGIPSVILQGYGGSSTDLVLPINIGDKVIIDGLQSVYEIGQIVDSVSPAGAKYYIVFTDPSSPDVGKFVVHGANIFKQTSSPNVLIATTLASFIVPALNGSVTADIDVAYTGSDGQTVWIGNKKYLIYQVPPPAPSATLYLINLSDTSAIGALPMNIYSVPEIQAGRMGAYGMSRNWYSLIDGISYLATDQVGDPSGSQAENYRDSVLKETENTFLSGGGTFRLAGTGDIITAMVFPPIMDTSLGQGALQIFTAFSAFSNNSPVDRSTWTALTSPLQTESLKDNGALAQNSTILINSDTFFRSNVGIGSFLIARRDFGNNSWGNKPISNELQRVLSLDNQSLLSYGSAVANDNRFISTCVPNVSGQGVFHIGLVTLNNDLISSLRTTLPPAWEGIWTGVNAFQMIAGRVNGSRRAFAFTFNIDRQKIELYEFLPESTLEYLDNDETPIKWGFESPVIFNGDIKPLTQHVRLSNGEMSLSDIKGTVKVDVKYRPINYPCWLDYHSFTVCADVSETNSQAQHLYRIGLGEPSANDVDPINNIPYREAPAFQFMFEIEGSCTFQGARFEAIELPMQVFAKILDNVTTCQTFTCTPKDWITQYSLQGLPPQPLPPVSPPECKFKNDAVYFNNVCAEGTPSYSGSLPNWIALDADNNRFVGAADTFCGTSVLGANNIAQEALNNFVSPIIPDVTCDTTPSCDGTDTLGYKIQGYVDGQIDNSGGSAPAGQPVWNGTFPLRVDGDPQPCFWFGWDSNGTGAQQIDGKLAKCVLVAFSGGTWKLQIVQKSGGGVLLWHGIKNSGSTAAGVYTNDNTGIDLLPATLTVVSNGLQTPTGNPSNC